MTGGTAMARFVMTGPPVLATRLARRKIKMGIKGELKFYILDSFILNTVRQIFI